MRLLFGLVFLVTVAFGHTVTVGSKRFNESNVLGEIALRTLRDAGVTAEHRKGIGATGILWSALVKGEIDVYPEYTGTLSEEILKSPGLDRAGIERRLAEKGLLLLPDLGFNDGYGLAMTAKRSKELGITTLSELARRPGLRAGITNELLQRSDGWPGLVRTYGLRLAETRGMEHGVAYRALSAGEIDVTDVYTTDAEIGRDRLVVLKDDRNYFPLYRAAFVARKETPAAALDALRTLSGTIDEKLMIRLNGEAIRTEDPVRAADLYFREWGRDVAPSPKAGPYDWLWPLLRTHLALVFGSLLLSVLVGVPLGIAASRRGPLSSLILGVSGVLQTIPSLALLVLLVPIPFFGISWRTAVAALFLYGLLPIVRNTAVGLGAIPGALRESARALGLEPIARLRKVYLPMAFPTIMAGIKTSAVTNVGTATLAALIGAGGLGERITSGLAIQNTRLILEGAIPAAALAVIVQLAFDGVERAVTPRGLKG